MDLLIGRWLLRNRPSTNEMLSKRTTALCVRYRHSSIYQGELNVLPRREPPACTTRQRRQPLNRGRCRLCRAKQRVPPRVCSLREEVVRGSNTPSPPLCGQACLSPPPTWRERLHWRCQPLRYRGGQTSQASRWSLHREGIALQDSTQLVPLRRQASAAIGESSHCASRLMWIATPA